MTQTSQSIDLFIINNPAFLFAMAYSVPIRNVCYTCGTDLTISPTSLETGSCRPISCKSYNAQPNEISVVVCSDVCFKQARKHLLQQRKLFEDRMDRNGYYKDVYDEMVDEYFDVFKLTKCKRCAEIFNRRKWQEPCFHVSRKY